MTASAWPLMARAQTGERARTVALLIAGDEEYELRSEAVRDGLRARGWIDGGNLRLDTHRPSPGADIRQQAAEIVASAPDVIVTSGSSQVGPLLQLTRTVPIVFTSIVDPVGSGVVRSLKRPGGNATGFMQFDYSLSAKWVQLLKDIVPDLTHAVVIRDAQTPSGIDQFAVIQSVAPSLGVDVTPANAGDMTEIERALGALPSNGTGGIIAATGTKAFAHADPIIALASRYRLPAVYPRRTYVDRGGLCSYGPDIAALARLAAGYVDRILKGEKPADLPVQAPVKYELVVNLRSAKAIGLALPQLLLSRADEVIE